MNSYGQDRVIDINQFPLGKLILGALIGIVLLVLALSSFTTIPAGKVGVLTLFGKVTGEKLDSGLHVVNPLKKVTEMTVRTQALKESADVPSSEGLVMGLDTSLVFHLNPDKAAYVYQELGPNYIEAIIEPTLRSAIREATASHSANALYSSARQEVQNEIRETLRKDLEKRGIVIEDVLLRDIRLPIALKGSIELKQQAEQESLAMNFRLQKEKQEAERKRIEASGIRDFQTTVSQGISSQLLEWKGIEATETLAKSNNTKIVVIGNSKNGLPLVLGGN
ncbi:MAG TPA: prohibitin family protein [Terriglobales bacterium]|nr:prohibitin family protein [Terriglobales bacterium]